MSFRARGEEIPPRSFFFLVGLFLFTLLLAFRVVVFQERVDFGTEQNHQTHDIQPEHRDDHGAQASIGGAVIAEVAEVVAESQGGERDDDNPRQAAGSDERKPLLHVGAEIIDQGKAARRADENNTLLCSHEIRVLAEWSIKVAVKVRF